MFASLLVANRGEIACRIFRTARALGVKTIAVYSAADARAKHVREADAAFAIGPAPPARSYLDSAGILEAAVRSGAAAIHPGYGFLSESPAFAEAVIAAGLIWVGPRPDSIRAMGLKDEAKRIAARVGAPIIPGYGGGDQSTPALRAAADDLGYPVLIKALAGGGGRGIREVSSAGEFAAALDGARREAHAAFGDDRVLVEKLIARPRHIEVQVFGDKHGGLVHLFERDCSLQRRRQKVIEESPAPGMSAEARTAMTGAALAIARAVTYENAGTVEFIVEGAPRADNFHFMEMNTRLQVEHPVTEAVTGVDLVEWQLRVAAGEALPLRQEQIGLHGWAMEARLNAEYPERDFLPSAGPIEAFAPSRAVRVDAGYDGGDRVPDAYDSLIAKLIAHRPDRGEALAALGAALRGAALRGVRTNAGFLCRLLEHPAFTRAHLSDGDLATDFIARRLDEFARPSSGARNAALAAAALAHAGLLEPGGSQPWTLDGFRINAPARLEMHFMFDGERRQARFAREPGGGFAIDCGAGVLRTAYVIPAEAAHALSARVGLERGGSGGLFEIVILGMGALLGPEGDVHEFGPLAFDDGRAADGGDGVFAPLPGRLIAVHVGPGAAVKRGQALAVIEAMKMEHTLAAPRDGVVAETPLEPGAQVKRRDLLVRLAPAAAE